MKRFFRALAIALIIAVLGAGCYAESELNLKLQSVAVQEDGSMQMMVYCSADEPAPADFSLTLDEANVPVDSVVPYGGGTTWIFLVDTASVSTSTGTEPVTALLTSLLEKMNSRDNAAIVTTGSVPENIELVKYGDTLKAWINDLKSDSNAGSLNSSINSAITFLNTDEKVQDHACLVVITNDKTRSDSSISQNQLQTALEDSGVTLYMITFVSGSNQPTLDAHASLADMSCGGISFQPPANVASAQDAEEVANVIGGISRNEEKFLQISCNPAAAGVNGANLKLTIERGNSIARASYNLSEEEQQKIAGSLPVDPTPEPTGEPTPEPTSIMDIVVVLGFTLLEVIIAGGCLLLAIIILVLAIVLTKRKRRKNKEEMSSTPVSAPVSPMGNVIGAAGGPPSTPVEQVPQYTAPVYTAPAYPQENAARAAGAQRGGEVVVTLTQIGSGAGRFSAPMRGQLLVGRDPRSAQMVLPSSDLKISGSHLVLRYEGGIMFAEDVSRNGTMVNDARIFHPTKLHQQDVLTLGATRFRITWVITG